MLKNITTEKKTTLQINPEKKKGEKILLALLPVWDPLIPPLGIACLKSFVQKHGYPVKTVDANIEPELADVHKEYFHGLKEYLPEDARRHLYNIGHEVLKNHMMAHVNADNEKEYFELVEILIFKTFFRPVRQQQILHLNRIIENYYHRLKNYLTNLLDRERPAVFGLSVYSGTIASSIFASRLAKERYPHIKIVMGGGIFSGELAIDSPEFEIFRETVRHVDQFIVGEGEQLLLTFLKGMGVTSSKVKTLDELNGEPLDLSTAPIPDFSDFHLEYYQQIASYTSRSCPFQCKFCVETTYWGKYRKKSAVRIVNELVSIRNRYGKRLFLMCDSLLNPVITSLARECIKEDTDVYWGGYLRVNKDACNLQNTLLWRRGGFYRARLGIESGSPRILAAMGKKIEIPQINSALSGLAFAGIKTTAMFVIGYPGETEEEFQMTLDLVEAASEYIYEADCNPFWYFLTGQVNSETWNKMKAVPLYPENHRKMLMYQTWILDCYPSREEIYRRLNRFLDHCRRLKIPNPYTLTETNEADKRWKKLHKNAVPSLVEINSNSVPGNERKEVEVLYHASSDILKGEGVWDFSDEDQYSK